MAMTDKQLQHILRSSTEQHPAMTDSDEFVCRVMSRLPRTSHSVRVVWTIRAVALTAAVAVLVPYILNHGAWSIAHIEPSTVHRASCIVHHALCSLPPLTTSTAIAVGLLTTILSLIACHRYQAL